MSQFITRAGRTLATATLFGALLSAPLYAAQVQQAAAGPAATQSAPSTTAGMKHSADRIEKRIKDMHDKLRITADQESLWGNVAQTMRDNGQAMRASMADRSTRLKTMTAVEDLKSYEAVADAHADGLKRLVPAFEALYAAMTPDQQQRADHMFGERQRHARG